MITWFTAIAFVVGIASVVVAFVTSVVVVLLRAGRSVRQRRWVRRDGEMRPLLLSVLDGDDVVVTDRRDRLHLIGVAARASYSLRGTDRATIATWLCTAGTLHEAKRLLRSRNALTRARGIELYLPIAEGHSRVLERLLLDRDRGVRALACGALGRAAALEAIPAVLAATGLGRQQIPPALTMMAITRMAPSYAASVLVPAADLTLPVRILAVELVGVLNLIDGRQAVEVALASSECELRIAALRTLAQLGLPTSAAALASHRAIGADEQAALNAARTAVPMLGGR